MKTSLVLATVVLAHAAQEQAPADTVTLRFDWPAEGSVRVREEALKKGVEAEMTYVLRWAPMEPGEVAEGGEGSGSTLLEYTDYEIVTLAGMDRANPLVKAGLQQAEAFGAAIPKLRIGPGGGLLGFVGFDEAIETLLSAVEDQQLASQLRAAMSQPQMRAMIESSAAETWNAWVGNWTGSEIVRGTEEVWKLDPELTGGVVPELRIRYGELAEHRGLDCVEISMDGDANEELLLRATLRVMGLLADEVGEELPDDLPIARMARRDTIRGIYAVAGLRPIEVETSSSIHLWETADAEPVEQREEHRYSFEWPDLDQETKPAAKTARVTVDTLSEELDGGTGGMEVDAQGFVYCADFGSQLGAGGTGGTKVFKLDPKTGKAEVFVEGLRGASGNAIGPGGAFFQSNIGGNFITRVAPDGTSSVFLGQNLSSPVGIAIDEEGMLFVANCGSSSILEVTPEGESRVFVSDPLLSCPNGITLDDEHNLYVANFNNGDVIKISWSGEVSRLATLPGNNNGHLVHRDGHLYVVARGAHQIYKVSLEGEVELLAGSGERGRKDGPALEATFSFPNDLAFSPDGKTLYVNENASTTEPHTTLAPMVVRRIRLAD